MNTKRQYARYDKKGQRILAKIKKAQRRIAKRFARITGGVFVQKMYTFDKKAEKRLDKKSEKRMIPVLYYLRTAT